MKETHDRLRHLWEKYNPETYTAISDPIQKWTYDRALDFFCLLEGRGIMRSATVEFATCTDYGAIQFEWDFAPPRSDYIEVCVEPNDEEFDGSIKGLYIYDEQIGEAEEFSWETPEEAADGVEEIIARGKECHLCKGPVTHVSKRYAPAVGLLWSCARHRSDHDDRQLAYYTKALEASASG